MTPPSPSACSEGFSTFPYYEDPHRHQQSQQTWRWKDYCCSRQPAWMVLKSYPIQPNLLRCTEWTERKLWRKLQKQHQLELKLLIGCAEIEQMIMVSNKACPLQRSECNGYWHPNIITAFINVMTYKEWGEYLRKGLCFNCKQPGHLSHNCLKKNPCWSTSTGVGLPSGYVQNQSLSGYRKPNMKENR